MKSFDYYGSVAAIVFDIKTYKALLKNYEREREELIRMQGPKTMNAITYDRPSVQASPHNMSDMEVLARIQELTDSIVHYKRIIEDKNDTLDELKSIGKKMVKQLKQSDRPDTVLEIFIATYIEGKGNQEIKDQGYAMQTIYNARSTINKYIEQRSQMV